jgi:hypothetical protein
MGRGGGVETKKEEEEEVRQFYHEGCLAGFPSPSTSPMTFFPLGDHSPRLGCLPLTSSQTAQLDLEEAVCCVLSFSWLSDAPHSSEGKLSWKS